MFTGIIEELGKVLSVVRGQKSAVLSIQAVKIFEDLKLGDSVAVNGVCLTVSGFNRNVFLADVMNETLSRSSLAELKTGSPVNLERAMPANGRFGGHIVSGHIDGTGVISNIRKDDNAIWFTIAASEKIMRYIVEKGSIAIDGISLTVAAVESDSFSVSIIPHTARSTVLTTKKEGDTVNIENDAVGKYIEKFFRPAAARAESGITSEFLAKAGFL